MSTGDKKKKPKKSGWDMTKADFEAQAKKWVAAERAKVRAAEKRRKATANPPKRPVKSPGATSRRSSFTYIPKKPQ